MHLLQTGWVWLLNEQGEPYLAAAQALPLDGDARIESGHDEIG